MIQCNICNQEFESIDSLRRHNSQKHKISAEQTYVEYVLNNIIPLCKCGCGEKPKYLGIETGFRDYIRGHSARINNNWGHNPDVIKKSHETQKKMYESGELVIWNKGLTIDDERVRDNVKKVMSNPERGKNISKKLIGRFKSDEHKLNISKSSIVRWENQEERDKQSERLVSRLIKNNYRNKKTKLEKSFQEILENLNLKENIDFKYQYQISSAIFDFLIIGKKL